jgi:hypothetical protein
MKNEGLTYQFRTLSQDEYEKEFPDDELEQESPTTDVDTDTDEEDSEESKETTADALTRAFQRVANGQSAKRPEIHVTDRKVNAPAPAPEAKPSYTQEAAAVALSAAIRKARGMS